MNAGQRRPARWQLILALGVGLLSCLTLLEPLGAESTRTLLCVGDSLTAGYSLDEAQAWPALLQARLNRSLPGWRVVNGGASGDTSADALKRLNWLLRQEPAAAFVCLGGNDGLRGVPLSSLEMALEGVIARLQASGVTVFLAGMDLPSSFGDSYRQDFKAVFPRVAMRMRVDLLPFLLEGVAGQPALNLKDGIHPNAQGQARVARTVEDFLLPRLKALPPAPIAPSGRRGRVLRRRSDLDQP